MPGLSSKGSPSLLCWHAMAAAFLPQIDDILALHVHCAGYCARVRFEWARQNSSETPRPRPRSTPCDGSSSMQDMECRGGAKEKTMGGMVPATLPDMAVQVAGCGRMTGRTRIARSEDQGCG